MSFSYCFELKKIVIPSSVTTIKDNAFLFCSSLKETKQLVNVLLEAVHN